MPLCGLQKRSGRKHATAMVEWAGGGSDYQLKLIKRQMYGRAKLDLLQARLIGAP